MKDFKKIIAIMVIMIFFFIFAQENSAAFVMGYATILSAVMVVNVMEIDEKQKSNTFLFTLPISRREYVLEKYLFGTLMGVGGWLISVLCVVGVVLIRHTDMNWTEFFVQGAVMLLILFLILGFEIPVQIKFGGEKGRIILIATIMIVCLGITGITRVSERKKIDWMGKIEWIFHQSWAGIAAVGVIAVFFILSLLYSIHLIEKKEY